MDLFSFLYSNLTLNIIIVLGYLSVVLVACLFPNLIRPNFGRLAGIRLISIKLVYNHNQLSRLSQKLAVLILCFNWFFFFNRNFLTGSIKTDSALVKTDEIILSAFQMLNSKKHLGKYTSF